MIRTIGLVAFMVTLLSLGVACLLFSHGLQRLAVKLVEQGLTPQIEPLNKFMRSSRYIVSIKVVGMIAILMFVVILWGSIRRN